MLLSEQIRTAIAQCGQSVYRLAMDVGVEEKSLRKFLKGETGISLASIDRIGTHLGLTVKIEKN